MTFQPRHGPLDSVCKRRWAALTVLIPVDQKSGIWYSATSIGIWAAMGETILKQNYAMLVGFKLKFTAILNISSTGEFPRARTWDRYGVRTIRWMGSTRRLWRCQRPRLEPEWVELISPFCFLHSTHQLFCPSQEVYRAVYAFLHKTDNFDCKTLTVSF